jgi:hypothetical protein
MSSVAPELSRSKPDSAWSMLRQGDDSATGRVQEAIRAATRGQSLDESHAAAPQDDSREGPTGTNELFILAISILLIANLVLVSLYKPKSSYWLS